MRAALERCNKNRSMQEDIANKEESERWRLTYCNNLKNYMAHPYVDGFVKVITDNSESDKLRIRLLQSLAWFTHSYRKAEIIKACDQLRNDKSLSKELREEANRTYYRLKD